MNSKNKTVLRLCVSTLIMMLAGCRDSQPRTYSIYCDNGFKKENYIYLRYFKGDIAWKENNSWNTYRVPLGVTCTQDI